MGRGRARRDDWRNEADDEWLAAHSSGVFAWIRTLAARLGLAGTLGEAVSMADTGPFAGAPRQPRLRPESKGYSTVRLADQRYAHTVVQMASEPCGRCGAEPAVTQRVTCVREDGAPVVVATVRLCAACQGAHESPMPATRRARERARRVVL